MAPVELHKERASAVGVADSILNTIRIDHSGLKELAATNRVQFPYGHTSKIIISTGTLSVNHICIF